MDDGVGDELAGRDGGEVDRVGLEPGAPDGVGDEMARAPHALRTRGKRDAVDVTFHRSPSHRHRPRPCASYPEECDDKLVRSDQA